MLIAMATGTGKTFLTVAQIYRLLESKAARRILFLVDRRALAAQAVREFAAFNTPRGNKFNQEYEVYSQRFRREDFDDDKPFDPKVLPDAYLTAPQTTHTFVYVSTIQRMAINLFGSGMAFPQNASDPDYEEDADKTRHPDPCLRCDHCRRMPPRLHGKETAIWRHVLDHFDAVKIGLTATPAPHTLSLFNEVVYRYTTEQAIQDGFLVDYEAVKIKSERPHERRIPQGGRAGRRDRHGDGQGDLTISSKMSGNFRPKRSRSRNHRARQQPEDHPGDRRVCLRARGRNGPFPQDPDLCRQRPAPHLPCRPGRPDLPGRVRPGRRFRPEDHRQPERGPAPAEDPGVPQPAEPEGRGDGGHALHRRGHPEPGVHRLPAPGEIPHPLGADAGPGHPPVPRDQQGQIHDLRLLRRDADRVFQEHDGLRRATARERTAADRADHRKHLPEHRPGLLSSRSWSSACAASRGT